MIVLRDGLSLRNATACRIVSVGLLVIRDFNFVLF